MPESEDQKEISNTDLRNSQFGGGFINAENVNAGRIGGDILNFFFNQQTTTPIGNPARPKNERILLAAVKEEVTARLKQSLHNAVLINLGKEFQPQQVKRPWDVEIKIGLKPAEPLPDTTTILQVFNSEEIAGKLLILGAPGAGKTATQLELAQALVNRAEEQFDYPVPVLFNLSSWKDDRQSLSEWLVAELKSKYGVSKKLGQEWVNNHQLLPLLDGLDELESQHQELCVHAINQFLAGETRPLYLVVCSRSEEYNNYLAQLQLNGAIYLQPLTESQICQYLKDIKREELWQALQDDRSSLEMAKSPLFLSIMSLTYQEISIQEWQQLTTAKERYHYLFNSYIEKMLTREIKGLCYVKGKEPTPEKTKQWLSYLAQVLKQENRTEFMIENIQPFWLMTINQKRVYNFCANFFIGWFTLLPTLAHGGLNGIFFDLSFSLFFGLYSLRLPVTTSIRTIESLRWSWRLAIFIMGYSLRRSWRNLLLLSLLLTFFLTLLEGIFLSNISLERILVYLGGCLSFILFIYAIFMFVWGLTSNEIERKKYPNQGIWKSAINAVIVPLIAGFITFFLLGGIGLLLCVLLINNLSLVLTSSTLIVLFNLSASAALVPFVFIAQSPIRHLTLRIILWWNDFVPWNYARFLNYANERLFLQRIGGGYRFIHDLLREHFAQLEPNREASSITELQNSWRVVNLLTRDLAGCSAITLTPDGKILASADKNIKLWELSTGKLLHTLNEHSKGIASIAITPDGQILVSAGLDKTIKVWNLNTRQLLYSLRGHLDFINVVVISPDGQTLASASNDKTIKVWNRNTGELLLTLKKQKSIVLSIAITPDSQTLVSGSFDGSIKLWDLSTGRLFDTLREPVEKQFFKKLWQYILPKIKEPITSIAISPDGQVFASGSVDKTIKVWHLGTGKLIFILKGHLQPVLSLAISPNGQFIVSGSADETIKLWNLNNGQLLHTLTGHSIGVRAIAISPDGQIIVSASPDRAIRVWSQFPISHL